MRNKEKHASPFRWMLRRYFFLAVIMLLISFAVFPMQGMMRVLSTSRYLEQLETPMTLDNIVYYTKDLSQNFIYSPLNLELLCLLFGGMGYAAAMVLFRHLFSRKQGMLIAGLPMTREKGFLLRVGVYALWCALPLALCMGVYPLMVRGNGLWQLFDLGLYLRMAGTTLLIQLYGFALGALSASLFGTIWSAALGALMIGVSVEVTLYCWIHMAGWYLGTLIRDQAVRQMLRFSPIYDLYKAFYLPMKYSVLPGLIAMVVFLTLAFLAYRRTMPEHAGHTLSQKRLEPVLAAWTTVLGGTAGAVALSMYLGREIILYIGLILGAATIWILMRMLLDQRIHISLRKWKIPAAVTLVMVCAFLGLRMDLMGYNAWRPETEDLTGIRVARWYGSEDEMHFADPESIEACQKWMDQARQEMLEARRQRPYEYDSSREVQACFEGKDGKEIWRQYWLPVDRAAVITYLRVMAESYARQQGEEIPERGNVRYYSRLRTFGMSTMDMVEKFGITKDQYYDAKMDAEKVREALRKDLENRTLDTMQEAPILNVYFEGEEEGRYGFSLTASDRNTLDLILGEEAENWIDYAAGGFARNEDVLVFQCDYEKNEQGAWKIKDWRMAESEEQVREWMTLISRCDDEWFALPKDYSRRVVIYSLEDLRDQMEYGELELDLEDPETLANLPSYENAWTSDRYYFVAESET